MVSISSRQTSRTYLPWMAIRQNPGVVATRENSGVSLRPMALVFGSTAHGDPGQKPDGEKGPQECRGCRFCVCRP